ncbi:hypothetical protein CPT_Stills109 [Bacillus phage Stills]|uniref:Uncharacterized protein n=1 Tax=Bacillus phage Stills TaxID=1610833 RepID=A0A0E3XA72_9CAUD|nr:hypothetical protein CPT_Stills109 [Bacillus phage Stills]AKC02737.1 hypothetical protein CPT_Stills109 [Bacillus phage Stills]
MEKVLFENKVWIIEISGGELFVSNKRLEWQWPSEEYAVIEKLEDVDTFEIKRVKIPKYIREELKRIALTFFATKEAKREVEETEIPQFVKKGYNYKDLLNDCVYGALNDICSIDTGISVTIDGFNGLYLLDNTETFEGVLKFYNKDIEAFKIDVNIYFLERFIEQQKEVK